MNKKILTLLAIVIIFLTISTASAGFFDFLDKIDTKHNNNITNGEKTFVMGVNLGFPPFEYKTDNGSYTGFDIDLAKEVCKRNNWTLVVQPIINWDYKEEELNSGEVDCIWSAFTINNRENEFTWTKPYFNNSQVFVVKSDSNISSISDLNGKTVEIQIDSSGLEALKGQNKTIGDSLKVVEAHDFNTAFMDLDSGVCDAVIVDFELANNRMVKSPNHFKILNESLCSEQYGVGFKHGNNQLKDQVQNTLDEMFKDGTVDRIAQNYSDYDINNHLVRP